MNTKLITIMKKNLFTKGALVLLLVFGTGIYIGVSHSIYAQTNTSAVPTLLNEKDAEFGDYWTVWKMLKTSYPFDQPTDKKRVENSIKGLVGAYDDPYTMFFPTEEAKSFLDQIRGDFGGVGIQIDTVGGVLQVIAPIKGSPSEKAGIRPLDIIYKVNGEEVVNKSIEEVVKKIKGEVGTKVTLTIIRKKHKPFDVELTRSIIKMPTIETELVGIKKDIFHIKFFSFSEKSAELFADALSQFKKSGTKKLIIDVRGNPGGLLDQCVDIVSHFLPKGAVIVKSGTRDKSKDETLVSYGTMTVPETVPVVVLMDKGSASASEILGGALQDNKRAKLIGTQSYGKGSVQQLFPIGKEGSQLKMTVAQWFTPNGTQISKKGLTPDIVSEPSDEDIQKKNDVQLKKAIEFLTPKKK